MLNKCGKLVFSKPKHKCFMINNSDKLQELLQKQNVEKEIVFDCLNWFNFAQQGESYNHNDFDLYID